MSKIKAWILSAVGFFSGSSLTILSVVLLLLFVLCAVFGISKIVEYHKDSNGMTAEEEALYNAEKYNLEIRKKDIKAEISSLETATNEVGGGAYISIVFKGLDEQLYDEAYKIMSEKENSDGDTVEREHPLVGVIAMSEDQMPGQAGKISKEQFDTLILKGWGTAVYYSGDEELDVFLDGIGSLMEAAGIAMPRTVLFAGGAYRSEYSAVLESYGIENVLHSGNEDLKTVEYNEPDGLWYPGYLGWLDQKKAALRLSVVGNGGAAAFVVDFTAYDPESGEDNLYSFDSRRFLSMVDIFERDIANGSIAVLSIDNARSDMSRYHEDVRALTDSNRERIEVLERELVQIEVELMRIYNKYYGKED